MAIASRRTLPGYASSKLYMRPYLDRSRSMIFGTDSSTALFRAAAHSPMVPLMNGFPPSLDGFEPATICLPYG